MNFGNEEEGSSRWNIYSDFLLFPRSFRVDIRANNTVNVYILDESAVRQWNSDKTLNPTWAYENIQQDAFDEQADTRGAYTVLAYLPANASTAIKITLTFSGLETDLLFASGVTLGIGVISVTASMAITWKKRKN